MSKFALAIFLIMLAQPAFASACFEQQMKWVLGEDDLQSGNNLVISNSPTILYAIGFISLLLAAAYMLGKAGEDQKLVFWAKIEGVNFAMSVALIAIVLGAFLASCEISQAIAGISDVQKSPAQAASMGLKKITDIFGVSLASDLLKSSVRDQFYAMYYAYWSVPQRDGGGLAYRANVRAYSTQKELLIDIYLPLVMLIELQRLFLDVALPGVVAIILPTALFFRLIFATRDIGNMLVALAFAIYFVLPLVYILALGATHGVIDRMDGTESNPFGKVELAKSAVVGDAFLKIGFVSAIALLLPNIAMVGVVTMAMSVYKALRGFGA